MIFVSMVLLFSSFMIIIAQVFTVTNNYFLNMLHLILEYLFSYILDPTYYSREKFVGFASRFDFVFQLAPTVLSILNLFTSPIAKLFATIACEYGPIASGAS